MDQFEEIMLFAMQQEEDEARYYTSLAERAASPDLRRLLLEHAEQEWQHRAKLEALLIQHRIPDSKGRFPDADLQLADYTVSRDATDSELSYQDALILAAKRERAAEKLYRQLASHAPTQESADILHFLADQEAKHRHAIETDYDDNILRES